MKAIFISVRTSSSRLPNKALKKINGKTTIEYLIDMVKRSNYAEKIILCTTELSEDDVLCNIAQNNGIDYFRGSSPDKLLRWLKAAEKFDIDFFVNADGDDIFFDGGLADICFEQYEKTTPDFIDGQGLYNDVYAMKTSALKLVCESKMKDDTEFIKPFFEDLGDVINIEKIHPIPEKYEKKKMRLTLDYKEDFLFFKKIIEEVNELTFDNIISYIEKNPSVIEINWSREKDWKENQENRFFKESYTKYLFDLSSKTVLITGSAGLLGTQLAEAIVEHGGTVIISDVNLKLAKGLCKRLNQVHGKTVSYPEYLDVLDKKSIQIICDKYEKIDVLINNAAKDTKVENEGDLSTTGRFETMTYDYWNTDMKVGLDGCFLCSQAVANKMVKDGGGTIINIASDLSIIAPDQRLYIKEGLKDNEQSKKPATYSVSKSAIHGLTKYMATYFADKNINVNCLSPAGIYNEGLPDDFVKRLTSLIPMGRMANVDEYKGAIIFLCSDASAYMTGHNLVMDGGRTIW